MTVKNRTDTDEQQLTERELSIAEVHLKLKKLPHYEFIQLMQKLCEDKKSR